MNAIATNPIPPANVSPQNVTQASGESMQANTRQNPFDLLLGMSMTLMSFEQSLAGDPKQDGSITAGDGQPPSWMLAAGLQEMALSTDSQTLVFTETSETVSTDGDVSATDADSLTLLTQALAGQLDGPQAIIQSQPQRQPAQNAETVVPIPSDFKGQMPSEILATAPIAMAESESVQGVWNLSELSLQIQQALKARQSLDSSVNSSAAELESGAVASKMVYNWAASPVQDASGNTRMPQMIEQVQQISDFLAERTEGVIKVGKDGIEANMRLYPPDLGGMRVSMTINNGTVQATFVAERAETAQLLQQHTQQFREMMGRHGLTVDQVQVTVSASAASSGANSYYPGQSGNSPQDQQEALWNRRQQRDPNGQQTGQQPEQQYDSNETGN